MNELVALLTEALAKLKDRVDAIVMPESIKGDQGDKGEKGDKGDQGDAGKDGADGKDGERGADGKDGKDGKDGLDGRDGIDGKNGQDGKDGQDGQDGTNGIDGKNGVDGLSIKGDKGDKPNHEWKGTKLRFELPSGEWGKAVDLAGKDGISRFMGGSTGVQALTSLDGSIDISNEGTTFNVQVSQTAPSETLITQVRNETGSVLLKGTVVYISGAAGNKAVVSKAIATGDATSAQTMGIITANILNNQNGYATVFGQLVGLDTSAFAEGAQLYLSSTVAGSYTNIKQYAPAHLVYIGIVTRSHQNQGAIEVRIQNGYEMDELHNVSAHLPANNDLLKYNSSTNLWEKYQGANGSFTSVDGKTITVLGGLITSIA
jgi:hypothetical protein